MDNNLKILSWNICWGCMKADDTSAGDGTARFLAQECKQSQLCLQNVVELINYEEYDIIGLQEAAKYADIINRSPRLRTMGCIHHTLHISRGRIIVDIDLTTFYNTEKFKVMAVKVGNIDEFDQDGRPYHIIFLEHTNTSDKYIIINLHNAHSISKNDLQRRLSNNIDTLFIVDPVNRNKDFMNIEDMGVSDGSQLFEDNTFKTIVLGDFNDHGRGNYWRGLQPFSNTSFQNLRSIVVSSQTIPPPYTCCTGKNSLRTAGDRDDLFGDYILIDNSLNYSTPNTIVKYFMDNIKTKLSSDHKPVFAIIEILAVPVEVPPAAAVPVPAGVSPPVPAPAAAAVSPPVPAADTVTSRETMAFFSVKKPHTLRLLNDLHDPNDPTYFKHKQLRGLTINEKSTLSYPLQEIPFQIPTEIFMYVVDKDNPNIIGYINKKYLKEIGNNQYRVENSRTLRLLANNQDPQFDTINGNYHRGATVTSRNILILPNGETTDKNFVLICDVYDSNKVGYINKDDLVPIVEPYHRKYIKYKYKYLQYKKILQ